MNTNATLEKLGQMRLHGFEKAYAEIINNARQEKFTGDELIAHLTDAEFDDRNERKIERLVKQAKFKQQASLEQINYYHPRGLDKDYLMRLKNGDWIKKSRDLLITGPTGVGKSFMACAIGFEACLAEFKVMYMTSNMLFDKLMLAKNDGTYLKIINLIAKKDLLIIDDFGLKKLDAKNCNMMLDIIDDRHARCSTIIFRDVTSNMLKKPTIADAILDRLTNASYRIDLQGQSMRKVLKI